MQVNLLLTARDPATALSLVRVIPQLKMQHWLTLTIICQEPAASIFQQQHISPDHCCQDYDAANSLIDKLFNENKYDAVLTGISGPDKGIDEITLMAATKRHIRRYALQSMWGDFNQHIDVYPDTIFALDHFAVSLNQKMHPEIVNVEVGSIKHSHLDTIPIIDYRIAFREQHNITQSAKVLGFYGQPLAELQGYKTTIEVLVNALANWQEEFVLFYRPHPKEPEALRQFTWTLFQSLNCQTFIDSHHDVFKSLAGTDVVLSAFSTCAIDALYMNQELNQAINSSVYLWFNQELIQWWQSYNEINVLPLTENPALIFRVDDASLLCDTIASSIERKQHIKEQARHYLPNNHCAANIICQTLAQDLLSD